jgi:hypothetical protein
MLEGPGAQSAFDEIAGDLHLQGSRPLGWEGFRGVSPPDRRALEGDFHHELEILSLAKEFALDDAAAQNAPDWSGRLLGGRLGQAVRRAGEGLGVERLIAGAGRPPSGDQGEGQNDHAEARQSGDQATAHRGIIVRGVAVSGWWLTSFCGEAVLTPRPPLPSNEFGFASPFDRRGGGADFS